MATTALVFLLNTAFGLFVYTLLLRFYMQLLRAPFHNPIGLAVKALTDFMVLPIRRIIPGWRGYDWSSLALAWLMQWTWLLGVAVVTTSTGAAGNMVSMLALLAVVKLLQASLYLLFAAVIIDVILSWLAPYNPLRPVVHELTHPFLRPLRRILPPLGGQLDLSPLILLVLIQLILITIVPFLGTTVVSLTR